MQCLNDPSKMQVRAFDAEVVNKAFDKYSVTPEDRAKITVLFNVGKMSDGKSRKVPSNSIIYDSIICNMVRLCTKYLTLADVGIAIGHAIIKRLTGEFANLFIWIN